jgi:hypothetical protein
MSSEYYETGYVDEAAELEEFEIENDIPDEPDHIALAHEDWSQLMDAEDRSYDAWVESRFQGGRSEHLIREREAMQLAVEALGEELGYSHSDLALLARDEFEFALPYRHTLNGLDADSLSTMLVALEKRERSNEMALKMAAENLGTLERKAS